MIQILCARPVINNQKVAPVTEQHRRSISIRPTSVSSDSTPQKTPHTTNIGNYQTDWNERRFRTNKGLQPPYRHIQTGVKVLLNNRFRVLVPAGAPMDTGLLMVFVPLNHCSIKARDQRKDQWSRHPVAGPTGSLFDARSEMPA